MVHRCGRRPEGFRRSPFVYKDFLRGFFERDRKEARFWHSNIDVSRYDVGNKGFFGVLFAKGSNAYVVRIQAY